MTAFSTASAPVLRKMVFFGVGPGADEIYCAAATHCIVDLVDEQEIAADMLDHEVDPAKVNQAINDYRANPTSARLHDLHVYGQSKLEVPLGDEQELPASLGPVDAASPAQMLVGNLMPGRSM